MKFKVLISILLALLPFASLQAEVGGNAEKLFEDHCAKCHGEQGNAHTWRGYVFFIPNFTSKKWQMNITDQEILSEINHGPSIMPSFEKKLTDADRDALAHLVRHFGAGH